MGRKRIDNKRVNTMITIDATLKEKAKSLKINISKVTEEALKKEIETLTENKNNIKK